MLLKKSVEKWGNACNIHLDPIVKLRKKCIRTITYSSYLKHTQLLFNSLNILCFHKLVIQRISLIVFKNEVGWVGYPKQPLNYLPKTMNTMTTILTL